jgi:hypothetical protein
MKTRVVLNGAEKDLRSIRVHDQTFVLEGSLPRIVRLEDEWYEDVKDPRSVIDSLTRQAPIALDLFTFWQRPPRTVPEYAYHTEPEAVAALPITDYNNWLSKQITSQSRNKLRKAIKTGVVVDEVNFDHDFADNMATIFNESKTRQGRHFWHFGKDASTVERQFSRYLHREKIFGAYYKNELIGFIFLGISDGFANLGQIISMIRHRDKAPNNALIAKAVEYCAAAKIPYLTYANWPPPGGLANFKRENGFQPMEMPRYYIPLSWKGRLALRYRLHRDWKEALPEKWRVRLKSVKARLAEMRS